MAGAILLKNGRKKLGISHERRQESKQSILFCLQEISIDQNIGLNANILLGLW